MKNENSTEYLNAMCHKIFRQLDDLEPVPGVQVQTGQGGGSVPGKPLPAAPASVHANTPAKAKAAKEKAAASS